MWVKKKENIASIESDKLAFEQWRFFWTEKAD